MPRPRRLLLFRPTLGQGGADRVTLTLLQRLDRRVFAPSLALMRTEGDLLPELPADVPLHDLSAASLWRAWRPLAGLLRRRDFDILFSTSGGGNLAACLAHRHSRCGARLVLSERNMLVRDQPRLKALAQVLAKRLLYPGADAITTVSEGVRQDLLRRLRLPSAAVSVVGNPIVPADLEQRAGEEPGHPWCKSDLPLILGAGRLVPAKGFDLLLRAFEIVGRRHERPRLLILGEGPERQRLEALARVLGIGDRVDLPGFVRNPFSLFARGSVFVLSSRFEGLPGVLIQAMACGLPVVAADCPSGPAEIVDEGRTGFLVPMEDPESIAERVCRLLERPAERAAIGRRASAASARFTVEAILPLYQQALLGETAATSAAAGSAEGSKQ